MKLLNRLNLSIFLLFTSTSVTFAQHNQVKDLFVDLVKEQKTLATSFEKYFTDSVKLDIEIPPGMAKLILPQLFNKLTIDSFNIKSIVEENGIIKVSAIPLGVTDTVCDYEIIKTGTQLRFIKFSLNLESSSTQHSNNKGQNEGIMITRDDNKPLEANSCALIRFNDYLFIESKVNGIETPVIFIFDTGTNGFIIGSALNDSIEGAKNLNIKSGNLDIQTSDFSFSGESFFDEILKSFSNSFEGKMIGGILGYNSFLKEQHSIIDFKNLTLSLYDKTPIFINQDILCNYEWKSNQLFIPCDVNGKVANFHFDTGIPGNGFISSQFALESNLSNYSGKVNTKVEQKERKKGEGVKFSSDSDVETPYAKSFKICGTDLGKTEINTMDIDFSKTAFPYVQLENIHGSIGNGMFWNYLIYINPHEQIIGVQKSNPE